ncbi:MAG: lipid kinase YegS [bacterium]|nr:lipid kinase YegS [bacterium]
MNPSPTGEWLLVHNPRSRRGARVASEVRGFLERQPPATAPRPRWLTLEELPETGVAPERVLALGGDGTINAVLNWLWRNNLEAPLAIVPAGTGNNLAKGLGVPLEIQASLKLALCGARLCRLDAGVIRDGRSGWSTVTVQSLCFGFPAHISARFDRMRRNPLTRPLLTLLGDTAYRLLAALGLEGQKRMERKGRHLLESKLRIDGEALAETVLALFVGNERSLGGSFIPCPLALPDDGKLDLCLVRAGTGANYWRLFAEVVRGAHLANVGVVRYIQFEKRLDLEFSSPTPVLVDGDIRETSDRFGIEVLPRRFPVVVPEGNGAG